MMAAVRRGAADYTAVEHARLGLAAAMRSVIDELGSTTATEDDLREAEELVARAKALLATRPHGRPYEGAAEGSMATRSSFVDHSPVLGAMNPLAPPIDVRFEGDRVIGTVTYHSGYEGPPGCVHGGFIASGFDEILGLAQSMSGLPGMTGRLEITYRAPTPLHATVRYEGYVTAIEGRKISTTGTLHHGDRLCAEGFGLFISMKPEVLRRLLTDRP
jgi:acyl-coenzyme A thioesterase PaaI-like protein